MKLRFKHKIIGLTTVSALLPIIVVIILTNIIGNNVTTDINKSINEVTLNSISQIGKDVYSLCETSNKLLLERVTYSLNVIRDEIKLQNGINLSNNIVEWQTINQYTKETHKEILPKLNIGNRWLGKAKDFSQRTPVIDVLTELVGGTITIFQKMNKDGDMLRVATSVKKLDGTRAVGTYIPAVNPDNTANPVVSKILTGETFTGRAFVVNAWYITIYEPIYDKNKNIIGMLYAGIQQDAVASITDAIKEINVGKTGQVLILGGKKSDEGKIILAKDESIIGQNILEFQESDSKNWLKNNIKSATNLNKGDVLKNSSIWKTNSTDNNNEKLSAITYFAPWDWVIVPTANKSDFVEIIENVDSSISELLVWAIIGSIIIFIITVIGSLFFSKKISDPITAITKIAHDISKGNLIVAKSKVKHLKKMISTDGDDIRSRLNKLFYSKSDETNNLLNSISDMTDKINSLISQLKSSSFLLASTSSDIAATSKQQEVTINEFNATTTEVATATQEISATTKDLVNTMDEVSSVANETKDLADQGKQSIDYLSNDMNNLSDVTQNISSRLSHINNSADNISEIINTITKVADQTNLLSLNAAIEAEKAGKYGKGFSVVSKEIRRLADQTAVATLDIENMIREMQESVQNGVSEMDMFVSVVKNTVESISNISSQFEMIIFNVQEISPRFLAVNEGMSNQVKGADQISDAIIQLSESAEQTAIAIKGFNKVTEDLNGAVRNLENEIDSFQSSK